jgi:hypothetical protein
MEDVYLRFITLRRDRLDAEEAAKITGRPESG